MRVIKTKRKINLGMGPIWKPKKTKHISRDCDRKVWEKIKKETKDKYKQLKKVESRHFVAALFVSDLY